MPPDREVVTVFKATSDNIEALRGLKKIQDELGVTVKASQKVNDYTREVAKSFIALERQRALRKIAEDAAFLGAKIGAADTAAEQLEEQLIAVGATKSEIDFVAREYNRLADEAERAEAAVKKVSAGFSEYADTRDRLRQQEIDALDPFNLPDTGGGGGGGAFGRRIGKFGALGREIRLLPAVRLSGNLSTDAIGKLMYTADAGLTALGASAATAGAAALIAAPAIIGVVLAMDNFNKTIEAGKRALNAAIAAQENYYNALRRFTTEQAELDLENRRRDQELLRQQIAETKSAMDSAFSDTVSSLPALGPFADLGARLLDNATPVATLREQYEKLTEEQNENNNTIARLEQGLANNAFAANDAAEAQEELAQALEASIEAADRARAAIAKVFIDQAEQTRQDILENASLRDLSSEAAIDRVEQLKTETQAIIAAKEQLENSGINNEYTREQISKYNDEIARNAELARLLTDVIIPEAQARERELELIKDTNDALQDQINTQSKIAAQEGKVTAASDALLKALQDASAIGPRIAQELADKEAEIRANASDKAADIAEQYGIDRQRAEEDLAKELLKIQRKFARTYNQAVGERDALAAFQAKEQRDDDLQDATDSAKTETRRKQENYKRQIRDLADATAKQLQTARNGAQKQLELEVAKAQEQIAIKQAQYNAEAMALIQLKNLALALAQAVAGIQTPGATTPIIPQSTGILSPAQAQQYIATGGSQPISYYQSRDSGGPLLPGKRYMVNGEPMMFSAPGYAYGMGGRGGGGLTININGKPWREVQMTSRKIAEREVTAAFDLAFGKGAA